MRRKTKEINDTKQLRKEKKDKMPNQLIINCNDEQYMIIKKLSIRDNQSSPDIWALKQLLRIAADRSREVR